MTGGAGFIGSHLVKRLLQAGDTNVTVIDNLSNNRQYYSTKPFGGDVSFYDVDIRNLQTVLDIVSSEEIDTCIHLSAKISVAESIISPFETIDVNVNGTLSILNACAANNVENFVFASSAAVYGEPRVIPVSEDHPLDPLSPYGASKIAGEALVSSFANSGKIKNAVSFRFFNVYGKGQSIEYAGVITKFIERISRNLSPIIFGDGNHTRDFISVHDIVEGILLAANKEISGIYNLGTGNSVSLNELAEDLFHAFGSSLKPIYSEPKPGDIIDSCADISLARSRLGFKPTIGVKEGISSLTAHIPLTTTTQAVLV